MIFVTNKRPDLPVYLTRLGYTVQFQNGRYETDNPDEIRALSRNPHVSKDTGASKALKREELDKVAEQAGVEHPERLPNKDAVVEAIEDAGQPSDH